MKWKAFSDVIYNYMPFPPFPQFAENQASIMDPTFPLVPIANFIACVLALLPLCTSIRQIWNFGVCMYAIWVATVAFCTAINTIVWSDNVNITAPVWCDISEYFHSIYVDN